MTLADPEFRIAQSSDAEAMADAQKDSIDSLGAEFYPPDAVEAWKAAVTPDLYLDAMRRGEVFVIAIADIGGRPLVLGFASDYPIEGAKHGTSCYVRGIAARRGIGTALLERSEAHAIANGAKSIEIEASLAGVDFYKANGYVEVSRGEIRLTTGYPIACVYMRKSLRSGRRR